ncbi:hypothetical protein Acsp04_64840 [Actinomadura sp. NBRC 104425]|uniref:hypothetical protein n=1 Tax=Actinomadura sp. NBRC 104425 TaxID=3032204 RepID=UPI0024A5B20B|nr:hypothetical protein [Actinomadura sp. NBRC 104425]GLZ16249.1 hypothetical protein Acsp04_64840 [Actinomadura sp. NBRC 104425]
MHECDPLSALGAQLGAEGLTITYTAAGLVVTNEDLPATDKITCRERSDDGGRQWYWAGRTPLAEAHPDHLMNAILKVRAHRNRCAGTVECER